jgi:hypothetical protein
MGECKTRSFAQDIIVTVLVFSSRHTEAARRAPVCNDCAKARKHSGTCECGEVGCFHLRELG